MSGEVSHHFGDVLEGFEEPENLNDRMEEAGIKFVEVKCGNQHALLKDDKGRIFTFGSGVYGQLGLGPEI